MLVFRLKMNLGALRPTSLDLHVLASGTLRKDLYELKMKDITKRRIEFENQLSRIGLKGAELNVTFEQVKEVFLEGNRASKDI